MNRLLPIAAFLLLPVALSWARGKPVEPLAPDRPLASLVPTRCLVYVESAGLEPWLAQGLEHPLLRRLLASPPAQPLLAQASLTPAQALERADAWLGASALACTADLSSGGLAFAFDPVTQKSLLLARGRDAGSVAGGLARVLDAVERQFGWPGALDRPQRSWSGADVWTLGEAVVARRDALLVLANDAELAQEALELAADAEGQGLLTNVAFSAAYAAREQGALAWTWLALEELEPLGDQGFRDLRAAEKTPAMQGVFGAELAALASAPALAATLRLDEAGLALELQGLGAERVAALAAGARPAEVPAELNGPSGAEALLYRDYAAFFRERAALFPPEALPGFAEAITNGALFFEGQDLGDDVLPHLSPWYRVVVRELEFPAERRPEIPLPGAALVAVLDTPEAGAQWQAAFQTIVALANVDQAQKGQRGMRLALGREGEIELSSARFATPRAGEGIDIRYNLEPCLAVVGRHLVVASHEELARQLVRELAGREPGHEGREFLRLEAAAVLAAVRANHGTLVAKKQIEEGLEGPAAEAELALVEGTLAWLDELALELDPAQASLSLLLSFEREEAR
ncbi:MAG: hypothetical protein ABL998_11965 [Planctomycetota bacterium]